MTLPKSLVYNFITTEFSTKKTSSGELRINSPFKTDTKYHLYIDPKNMLFIDYKSGEQGNMITFLKNYLDLRTYRDVILYLVSNYGTSEDKEEFVNEQEKDKSEVIKEFLSVDKPTFFGTGENLGIVGARFYEYALNRKIAEKYLPTMGYVFNENSKFNGRLIIPYFEANTLAYFVARDIKKDSKLRYRNPDGLDTKKFVLNIDNIEDELVICEGPLDALSLDDQIGTAMASGDIGVEQIKKIFGKKPNKIIYVPDSDATGKAKMDKNIQKIIEYCPYPETLSISVFRVPSPFKDFNEYKMATGRGFILKKECEPYKANTFREFAFTKKKDFG